MWLRKNVLRILACTVAAVTGIAAAMLLFMSVMTVKVEDSSMLPELLPGSRVVAVRTDSPLNIYDASSIGVGDMVVYRVPYYDVGSEGVYCVRHVSGVKADMIEVSRGGNAGSAEKEVLSREKISGKVVKVLYNG
ncbi:MAG: S26 family signal peptidase [Anaerovoracaceae bacterium]